MKLRSKSVLVLKSDLGGSVTGALCGGLLALTVGSGCASIGSGKKNPELDLAADAKAEVFVPVKAVSARGEAAYDFAGKTQQAEWLSCRGQGKAVGTVLVMHADRVGFDPKRFCAGWIAQTFLSQNYDVMTVNRPGFGTSTGAVDYSGAASRAALAAAVPAALAAGPKSAALVGAWGYGSGAVAAALAAKELKTLQFLLLGGGVYDFEDAAQSSKDADLLKEIAAIKKAGGDKAIEERSLAYDASGLPKRIAVYAGKDDQVVPSGQAKALADALESSGDYKVTFQLIDGAGHDIPWFHHRKVLEVLLLAAAKG